MNNNENTSGNNTIANAVSSGGNTGTGNTTFIQQQKSIRAEREEEKRRLQAEMRRRESELLAKIKAQQRELESMKQEKGKVCNTFLNGYGNVFLNAVFKNTQFLAEIFSQNDPGVIIGIWAYIDLSIILTKIFNYVNFIKRM